MGHAWCDSVRKYLTHNFAKEVLTFDQPEENPFDQPFNARQLLGFMKYLADFPNREYEQLRLLHSAEKSTVYLFFNCHQESISEILGREARADLTKLSFAQNVLDNFGLPHYEHLDKWFATILKERNQLSEIPFEV